MEITVPNNVALTAEDKNIYVTKTQAIVNNRVRMDGTVFVAMYIVNIFFLTVLNVKQF